MLKSYVISIFTKIQHIDQVAYTVVPLQKRNHTCITSECKDFELSLSVPEMFCFWNFNRWFLEKRIQEKLTCVGLA